MPGSRRSEAPRLLPIFAQTVALLAAEVPGITPVIPVSHAVAALVQQEAATWPVPPVIVTELDDKHDAYAAAAAALTKSGTSTLELALAGVPMAVTYRVNPISAFMARRMIRVPHVAMVNLLAGREAVPELLQADCNPETLCADGAVAAARPREGGGATGGVRGGGREFAGAGGYAVRKGGGHNPGVVVGIGL